MAASRDAGIKCVKDAFSADDAARVGRSITRLVAVIEKAGYSDQFTHRTGHNIGRRSSREQARTSTDSKHAMTEGLSAAPASASNRGFTYRNSACDWKLTYTSTPPERFM